MRIDMSRVAAAAIEAALDQDTDNDKPRRGRMTGVKAVATGAALVVAAQAAAKRAPVHRLADLASLPERLRERAQDRGWLEDDDEDSRNGHYDEPVDEEDEDFEPEDEEDENFEPEDEEEEPQAGAADEEAEPENRASEPTENGADAHAPGLALLSAHRTRPRFMSRAKARVDPAARPPEPPEYDDDDDEAREAGS